VSSGWILLRALQLLSLWTVGTGSRCGC
ncbi:hypothetical protein X975_26890, partial [Stegodyphus mimosarum]